MKRYARRRGCRRCRRRGGAAAMAAAPAALPPWLHAPAPPETSAGNLLRPSDRADGRRPSHPDRRVRRARARALAARHAGTPAAAITARYRSRAPRATRRSDISAAMRTIGPKPTARRWPRRCWLCSRCRASHRCSRRQPRRGLDRRPAGSTGQPPALVSGQIDRLVVTPRRGPDRRLQDQPRPARDRGRGAAGLCPPARALPRGAGASFIPERRSAPRCSGPKRLN